MGSPRYHFDSGLISMEVAGYNMLDNFTGDAGETTLECQHSDRGQPARVMRSLHKPPGITSV